MQTISDSPALDRLSSSCRRCAVTCDKVVYPSGCLASGCDRLVRHDESGRTFVGCSEKVFRVEIDLDLLITAEGYRGGFGGLRVASDPLPVCQTAVDLAFPHREMGPCLNPDFRFSAPRNPFTVRMDLGETDTS